MKRPVNHAGVRGETHMKKILSLLLALMLLALCPAMAETAVETKTLTSPKGDYSLEVPQDYATMDAELLISAFSTPEMQQMLAQMMGLEDASLLKTYFEMAEASNMMMVYAADWIGNFNVQVNAATVTMEQLVALKSIIDASMVAQYTAMGFAEENVLPMDIQEIAGRQWYGLHLEMAGMQMQCMITIANGMQYTLTFTMIDAEVMENILASFTTVAIAE